MIWERLKLDGWNLLFLLPNMAPYHHLLQYATILIHIVFFFYLFLKSKENDMNLPVDKPHWEVLDELYCCCYFSQYKMIFPLKMCLQKQILSTLHLHMLETGLERCETEILMRRPSITARKEISRIICMHNNASTDLNLQA